MPSKLVTYYEYTCDACGDVEKGNAALHPARWSTLKHLKAEANHQGIAVGNGDEEWLLCADCRERMTRIIRSEIRSLKAPSALKEKAS